MTSLNEVIATYQRLIAEAQKNLSTVKNKIYRIGTVRLLLFIAGVAGIFQFYDESWLILCGIVIVTFIPFLVLVKYHNRLFYRKDYLEKEIEINKNELSAIQYDTSCFDGGKEYVDPSHLYSYDIDLFGNNSLFQYLNRTVTSFGKEKLAAWFIKHLDNKKEIEERQEAVRELAPEFAMRQRFRILGLLYKGESSDGKNINEWARSESFYRTKTYFRIALLVIPLINFALLVLGILGALSFTWLGLSFFFFVICSFTLQKGITNFQTSYGKKLKILATYAVLMKIIEKRTASAAILKKLQSKLSAKEGSASAAVEQLAAEMNTLDQRNNVIVSTILNGFLFWELRQVMRIEKWKENHAKELPVWLEVLGEMDALCSLATFDFNHPDYAYAEISAQPFELTAKNMGHPLMNRDKCVKNNVEMSKRPFFVIITGANMAGKSTYLRTIGVNYLLACIGAPVCCEQMKLYPSHLITSLRTSDSLTDNESYFFAELKRLKLIIDKLNAKEELFIILDEILKGTNSMDKQKGSFALIKQFMTLQANGIIATHDLLLGSLVDIFPDNIHNDCFEAEITNNELTFSYRLKEGVAQNMNACFLMKKMGIVVDNV
ncbi:MAG: hypothetical protein RSA92_01980 [Bacteroidaceae bacterium]